jgi:hypothetical protein
LVCIVRQTSTAIFAAISSFIPTRAPLFGAHFDKIRQFPVVGERFPFAGLVQDRQTQRMVALNPMRLAYGRRLPQGNGIINRLKFYVHCRDYGLFGCELPWGVSLTISLLGWSKPWRRLRAANPALREKTDCAFCLTGS